MYKTRVCKNCTTQFEPVSSTQSKCDLCRHKCNLCPAPKVGKGSYCSPCTVALAKRRKDTRIARSICVDCGVAPSTEGFQRCEGCMVERAIVGMSRYRAMKIKAVNYLGGKCVDCGLKTDRVEVYDFHHLDPTIKDDGIGELLRASWETIVAELDKCIVLCCNCHRIRERDIDEASMKARCLSIGRTLPEHLAA